MRNEIIEKAQELGQMIAESEESEKVRIAADRMNNDNEALTLLYQYNENKRKATEALRGKEPTKEELEEFRDYVQEEFNNIMKNQLIAEYLEADKNFESLVNQVNAVLSYFITGQEQNESGGCSGNCAGCTSCG